MVGDPRGEGKGVNDAKRAGKPPGRAGGFVPAPCRVMVTARLARPPAGDLAMDGSRARRSAADGRRDGGQQERSIRAGRVKGRRSSTGSGRNCGNQGLSAAWSGHGRSDEVWSREVWSGEASRMEAPDIRSRPVRIPHSQILPRRAGHHEQKRIDRAKVRIQPARARPAQARRSPVLRIRALGDRNKAAQIRRVQICGIEVRRPQPRHLLPRQPKPLHLLPRHLQPRRLHA